MPWTSPASQATGDLITATLYNAAIGASGNIAFLGASHDHTGDAGDGATLALKAILGAGVYALGQKQGMGAQVKRLEIVQVTITWAAADEGTGQTAWDNPFTGALDAVFAFVISAGTGGITFPSLRNNGSNINAANIRGNWGGAPTGTIGCYVLGIGY